MTSSTGTDEHPEVFEISALADGLLPPDRTDDVREHLAGCNLCADIRSSLEDIRTLLGTLPGPLRMPSDVAGRIDAALAAEALLDATAPVPDAPASETEAVSRETAADGEAYPASHVSRETRARVSRETSGAGETAPPATSDTPPAAVDRPAGHPRAATGPGRQPHRAGNRRGRRWSRALLGAACAAAVLGGGALFVESSSHGSKVAGGGTASARPSAHRSDALSAGQLRGRVHKMLTPKDERQASSSQNTTKSSPNVPLSAANPQIPSCVRARIHRTEPPLAAEKDVYAGTSAYVVVLPHHNDSSRVDAYVIDASCTHHASSSPGALLLRHTYPRH